jgi:hypothetical protein
VLTMLAVIELCPLSDMCMLFLSVICDASMSLNLASGSLGDVTLGRRLLTLLFGTAFSVARLVLRLDVKTGILLGC